MLLGYFSSKQAELIGIVLYESPDGHTIECTQVDDDGRNPPLFDDVVCHGEVTNFIRRVSKGTLFPRETNLAMQIEFLKISTGRGDDASKG